jgi:hypothetical protein
MDAADTDSLDHARYQRSNTYERDRSLSRSLSLSLSLSIVHCQMADPRYTLQFTIFYHAH